MSNDMKQLICDTPDSLIELMRVDPGLAPYKARRLAEYVIEARSSAASVLLIWPDLWKNVESFQSLMQHYAHEACQTVLLGDEHDFDALMVDVARTRLFCWALPIGVARLRTNLKTMFADMVERHLVTDQQKLVARYRYELDELVAIARSLSSEQEFNRLLELILEKSRYITGADAGSVYVVEEGDEGKPVLRFKITQNDSVKTDFAEFTMEVSERSIVGNSVLKGVSINIPDLYSDEDDNPWSAHHDRSFDKRMGYESHSMLTVPMIDHRSDVIGVIQIINRKRDPSAKLQKPEDFQTQVVPFDERSEELALSLASLAGIALENTLLYSEVKRLFEGLVEASVAAIESRDPTTSGHSKRVAELTCALAREVDSCTEGSLASVRFTKEQIKEIKYAGLLHDFGKVGVREHILVKADKLYPEEMAVIKWRFDAIKRSLEADRYKRRAAALEDALTKSLPPAEVYNESSADDKAGNGNQELKNILEALDKEFHQRRETIEKYFQVIQVANRPSVLQAEASEALEEIRQGVFSDADGGEHPLLSQNELKALMIPRGSLTHSEREEIQSHVEHSGNFLRLIPWGKNLHRVPEIASKHHEMMDGSGYPKGITAQEIPVEARMMAIADIFDALTASDRPYKKAMPVERALAIIEEETEAGKYDPELFRLFVEKKIYRLSLELNQK